MAGRFGETTSGARTPEELDILFEDAILLRDSAALAALFDDGAVLATGDGGTSRGGAVIARRALTLWDGERTYVADPQRVLQARDLALVVAERGIAVMRRGGDETWRYAIALLLPDERTGSQLGPPQV